MALVQFKAGTLAAYVALAIKDANTLYFCEDAGLLYKGDTLFSGAHVAVESFPEVANAKANTLYISTTTGEVKYFNGSNYTQVVKPYTTIISESSTHDQLPTALAVYTYIEDKLGTVAYELPMASASTLGGVKVGTGLSIDSNGVLSATGEAEVDPNALPVASATTLGAVKVGDNLSVDETGVLSATDYTVTVTESTPEGYAKAYTFTQNGQAVATVNIPRDMVVSAGSVETYTAENLPTGAGAPTAVGTYLVLTLANAASDKVYINVADLIEYVSSGSAESDAVQIAVSADHKITATLKPGSITADMLSQDVKDTIVSDALKASDITTGATNGTIAVKGIDVPVYGLGTAAYEDIESLLGWGTL